MSRKSHTFNEFQNKDDDLLRGVIIGTLHSFRDKIFWYNVINSEKTKVEVPFYFTMSGSERFLMDIFLNEYKLENGQETEGVYNKIPRATVNLSSITIEEEYLTNKFLRKERLIQESDGEVKQYSSEFQNIPIKLDMDIVIHIDSIIDVFKSIRSIIDIMYKNQFYYVDVSNTKIHCQYSIPDSINKERSINFGFSDKKEKKIEFSIEVRFDYPMFKEDTQIFSGNKMETIVYKVKPTSSIEPPTRENLNVKDSSGNDFKVIKSVWPTLNNKESFYPNEDSE